MEIKKIWITGETPLKENSKVKTHIKMKNGDKFTVYGKIK